MLNNNVVRTVAIITTLIAFGAGIGVYSARLRNQDRPPDIPGLLWPMPKHLQAFTMLDQNNADFGLQNLQGRWSLLFFGYTNCPDICPITLNVLDQVYDRLALERQEKDVQMIFVSVDPERDNIGKLHDYVNYFNAHFVGLGGTPEQVQSLTKQLGIAYYYEQPGNGGDYLVDHSAAIFLVDPAARVVAILSAPHQADGIHARFLQIRSFVDRQAQS